MPEFQETDPDAPSLFKGTTEDWREYERKKSASPGEKHRAAMAHAKEALIGSAAVERKASRKRVIESAQRYEVRFLARGESPAAARAEAWAHAISDETGIAVEKCRAQVDKWASVMPSRASK